MAFSRAARAMSMRLSSRMLPPAQASESPLQNASAAPLFLWQRQMSSAAELPTLADKGALQALRTLLAHPWYPQRTSVLSQAESALRRSSDVAAKEALEKAKAAAEAVDTFAEKLEQLRMELDGLSGGKFGGESVGVLPVHVKQALVSALQRYQSYLGSFGAEEEWLRKKVQEELGSQLLLVKQRCSGLETEWNQVSLLGTSGLSGSYIEKRST